MSKLKKLLQEQLLSHSRGSYDPHTAWRGVEYDPKAQPTNCTIKNVRETYRGVPYVKQVRVCK